MRHNKKFNHLGRKKAHRDALLANMTIALIQRKRIFTTMANRRLVFSYLQNKEAVTELFREISQKIADRPGGYTRILKTGNRLGDNAKTCFIELVDYNENMLKEKAGAKKSRTRRSRKSSAAATTEAPAAEAPATEAPATEAAE
jgi:large subunit ribosomal protein L17